MRNDFTVDSTTLASAETKPDSQDTPAEEPEQKFIEEMIATVRSTNIILARTNLLL